ncbi:MAG TPA: SusC/RagA family TonB-linked outer membrane protein [Cyclobacteriaceae bacterium]|nr:SusC/RagA family TonB-linked outer membrane protein [Cyclobacteriaceae bacterium]
MKKSLLGFIVLLSLISASVVAQTVTGRVTADADGTALAGVSILVKGTSTGTSTDADGKFSLNLSDKSAVLVVSFIGFATQEIAVGDRTTIDVVLQDDRTQLSEVVVTALGIPRETKTLVYATQQVKPAELIEVRDANNVLNSLQGKVANALITQGSGGPGSGVRIVLRGNRSIQGTNNALIVVDGVPITNGTNGTVTSDFGGVQGSDGASNINPDDIESMTILRGASAAALYGSQAGNGVIVITTKKGGKDKMTVSINSGIQTDTPFSLPAVQNSYGQGFSDTLKVNAAGRAISGQSWGPALDGRTFTAYNGEQRTYSAQPNNIKDFFRTGLTLNNSIGVSGGSAKMQTYMSYTNNSVQGILPRNNMNRHTLTLRLSNQISKKFSTDAKVTYILQDIKHKYSNGESLSAVMDLYLIPRNVSLADAQHYQDINNVGVPVPAVYPTTNLALWENPYWIVHNTNLNENRERITGFVSAKYNITDWLHVTGRANLDKITDRIENSIMQGTLGVSSTGGGNYSRSLISVTQKWFDVMLDGSNKLTDHLKLDYRVGAILKDNKYDQLNNSAGGLNVTNFFSLNFGTNPIASQYASEVQTQAVFGQVNLAYKEAIFLDASLRNEWDSRLPKPYTFSYPSVGLSGIISDLVVLPQAISFLKLSGNYAVVGNGGQEQARFNTYDYAQGAGHGYITRSGTKAIPNLKPELVGNLEFGIDAKFLQNRFGFQFTVYKSNSTNQLLKVNVPPGTGFYDQYINAGNIQNKGLELVLNATPVKAGKLTWNIAFNMGMNRNKIIKLTDAVKSFDLQGFSRSATPQIKEGGSYGDMVAFAWQKSDNGNNVVTTDGKPVLTKDLKPIGNFNPKAILGLTNTFTFDKISFRILIDGRVGGVVVDGTEQIMAFNGITKGTLPYREGGWNLGGVQSTPVDIKDANGKVIGTKWPEGAANSATITSQDYWNVVTGGRYGAGQFFAYDATNFRIRELSLGYSIPLPSSFLIKSARLSLIARNVLWLYRGSSKLDVPGVGKRKMSFDPDMALGNGNWQGVSYGVFPSTRSLGFNLQLTF